MTSSAISEQLIWDRQDERFSGFQVDDGYELDRQSRLRFSACDL
jgi:hypothetical protein